MGELTAIHLGGSPEPWLAVGLAPAAEPSTIRIGSVACHFDVAVIAAITALGVTGLEGDLEIDGILFRPEPAGPVVAPEVHPCRASVIDHVVVMTSSLDRTCGALASELDAPLRRTREVGAGVRQGFHRLGEVIIEVVETPQVTAAHASLWGLVVVVDDLHGWAEGLGTEMVAAPKPAVQRGRWISNVLRSAGLALPVAFMSPEPRQR